jgi:hypothetical protein
MHPAAQSTSHLMNKEKPRKTPPQTGQPLRDIKDWQAVLAIVVVLAVFFRDILFQKAFMWEDFLYQYYPWRNFAAVSLAGSELPLWNPYTFNGMPFQADIQTALFYIPNLLLTIFVHGERLPFYVLEVHNVLHFAIAAICMYYLGKSYGLRNFVALFSGLVFSLSGFLITHAIHQTFICQVAWLPLIVLLFRKALLNRSVLSMILGAFMLSQAVLAGSPQLSLYIFVFLFALFLFEFIVSLKTIGMRASFPMVFLAAGVVIIAVALSAIQLMPTMELAGYSQRSGITYQKSLDGSLAWEQLITLVVPKFFGTMTAQGVTYWGPGIYGQYIETCIYVGIAALVCTVLAASLIRKNRHVAFYFGVMIFALLYALGDSFILHKFFFSIVPGFEKFRNPGRMTLLFTFAGALLSGFGLQRMLELAEEEKRRAQRTIAALGGLGILIWFVVQVGVFQPTNDARLYDQVHAMATSEATTALILVLMVCGVLFLFFRNTITAIIAVASICLVQFVDISLFGFNQNNARLDPKDYYGRSAGIVKFLKEEGKLEYFRVNSREKGAMILDRNQGMIDRIFLMEGYTPLALQRAYLPGKDWDQVRDMLNAKYRIVVDEQRQTMSLARATTYLPRAYFVYRDTVIKGETEVRAFMEHGSFDPTRMIVLEEDPAARLTDTTYTNEWSAIITSYNLNAISLAVATPKDGYLVLSEVYYPGWHAYVDGARARIDQANWNLRAVRVGAGRHQVEVRFEPESFRRGTWVTLTTVGIAGIGLAYSLRKKRKAAKVQ